MISIEIMSESSQTAATTTRRLRLRSILAILTIHALLILPKDASAFQTVATTQRLSNAAHCGSDNSFIGNDICTRHQFLLQSSQRRQSSIIATTSTALHLFEKNQEDEEEKVVDIDSTSNDKEDGNMFTKVWPTLKIALPSFVIGGIATLFVLFLPLMTDYYDAFNSFGDSSQSITSGKTSSGGGGGGNNNNNINQPVILFETILNDLNNAYVDDVDIQKLFETGVKAMTASLDPYTEFESRTEAVELEESVTGRYGGVGLVIRGGTNLAEAAAEDDISLDSIDSSSKSSGSSNSQKQPKNASKSPVVSKDDDEEDIDIIERKRARRKSMEEGVRVVSAFEGYAYDAGMRVGDKLLAVDDFEILPTTSPDEVRNHLRGEPGTEVQVKFLREGVGGMVNEPQTITLKRSVVQIPDVKYFGFIGEPSDGVGYIDLTGFANNAGREVRYAVKALQHGAELMAMRDGESPKFDDDGKFVHDPTKLKVSVFVLMCNEFYALNGF